MTAQPNILISFTSKSCQLLVHASGLVSNGLDGKTLPVRLHINGQFFSADLLEGQRIFISSLGVSWVNEAKLLVRTSRC